MLWGPGLGRGGVVGAAVRGNGSLLFLWVPHAETRVFLNGGFTETIISYSLCKQLNTVLIKMIVRRALRDPLSLEGLGSGGATSREPSCSPLTAE